MNKTEILITIKDSHLTDGERESFEMTTKGLLTEDGDKIVIEYEEQYDELAGCKTTLTVVPEMFASIIRLGGYSTEMIIEMGKHHSCEYNTPYGSMLIGIGAKCVSSTVKDGCGTIKLEYTIDFYGGVASENEMNITIERI